MTLVDCNDCGRQISRRAAFCPNCGGMARKPRRGFFGQVFNWGFIGFNAIMAWAMIAGIVSVANKPLPSSDVLSPATVQTVAAFGTGIGLMLILTVWVMGAVILGLLALVTRAKH